MATVGVKKGSSSTPRRRNGIVRNPQIKRSPQAPVTYQGWLYKQGSDGLMLWKKRWFVLSEFCLFYYEGPEEEKVLGSILLPSYKVSPCGNEDRVHRKFSFKAEHQNMRTYYFAADTKEAMIKWMNCISLATILQQGAKLETYRYSRPTSGTGTASVGSLTDRSNPGSEHNFNTAAYHRSNNKLTSNGRSYDTVSEDSRFDASFDSRQSENLDNRCKSAAGGPRPSQPLYANAPPKPKRLNTSRDYSSSPERSPERGESTGMVTKLNYPMQAQQFREQVHRIAHPLDLQQPPPPPDVTLMTDARGSHANNGSTLVVVERRTPDAYGRSKADYEAVDQSSSCSVTSSCGGRGRKFDPNDMDYAADSYRGRSNQAYGPGSTTASLDDERLHHQTRVPPVRIPYRPQSADILDPRNTSGSVKMKMPPPPSFRDHPDPWSEEAYALQMRQMTERLAAGGAKGPGMAQTPRQQVQDRVTPGYRHGGNVPGMRNGYQAGLSREELISRDVKESAWWQYVTDPPQPHQRRLEAGWSTSQENLVDQSEANQLMDKNRNFHRSASARLPQRFSEEHEAEAEMESRKVGQREESMKRLLEWKQRMLQSPLTRKARNPPDAAKTNPSPSRYATLGNNNSHHRTQPPPQQYSSPPKYPDPPAPWPSSTRRVGTFEQLVQSAGPEGAHYGTNQRTLAYNNERERCPYARDVEGITAPAPHGRLHVFTSISPFYSPRQTTQSSHCIIGVVASTLRRTDGLQKGTWFQHQLVSTTVMAHDSAIYRDRGNSQIHPPPSSLLPASAPIPITNYHEPSSAAPAVSSSASSGVHNYYVSTGRAELNRLADELLQVQRHVGQLQARGQELRSRIASYTDLAHLAQQQKQRLTSTSSPQRLAPAPAAAYPAAGSSQVPAWFQTDLDRGQPPQQLPQLHHSNGQSRSYANREGINGEAPTRPAYPAYFEVSPAANGRPGASSRMGGHGKPLSYYANEPARHSWGAGCYPQDQEDVKFYGNGRDRLPETRTVRDVKREQGERKNKYKSKDSTSSRANAGVPMSASYHEERSYDRESFRGPRVRRLSQPQVSFEKAAYDSVVTQLRDSLLILRDSQAENRVPNSSTYSSLSPWSDTSSSYTSNGKPSLYPSNSRLGLSRSQPSSPRRMAANPPYRPPPDYPNSRSSSRFLQPTSWNATPIPSHHRSLHDLSRTKSPSPERMSTRSLPRSRRGSQKVSSSSMMNLGTGSTDAAHNTTSAVRRLVPKVKRRHLTVTCSQNVALETRYCGDDDDDWLYGVWTPEVVRSSKAKPLKIDNQTIDKLFLAPDKINIPERYIPEHDLSDMSAEERLKRLKKADHIKKMLSRTPTEPVISSSATMSPDLSQSSAKEKMAEERKRREQMLNLSQVIAQQVKERSKMVAGKVAQRAYV